VSNVVSLFAAPIGERVADKVVPPVRTPGSLAEYSDAAAIQVARDRHVGSLGTWVAVGAFAIAFFVVRDWRQKRRQK